MLYPLSMQVQMGFVTAEHGHGSTFYFKMSLYSTAFLALDLEQSTRTLLLSHNKRDGKEKDRETITCSVVDTRSEMRSEVDTCGKEEPSDKVTLTLDAEIEPYRLTSEYTGGISNKGS